MGVKYRPIDDILKQIKWHEAQISKIQNRGGRTLAVLRRGC